MTFSFDTPTQREWRARFRADLAAALTRKRMTHRELADRMSESDDAQEAFNDARV